MLSPNYKAISKKIKRYRQSNGLSHMDFAIKSGIGSKRTVSRYEEKINDIKLSSLYKIAQGLEIHPRELL